MKLKNNQIKIYWNTEKPGFPGSRNKALLSILQVLSWQGVKDHKTTL